MMKPEYRGECAIPKQLKYIRPKDPSRKLDEEIRSLYIYSALDFLHVQKLLKLHNRKPVPVCINKIYIE